MYHQQGITGDVPQSIQGLCCYQKMLSATLDKRRLASVLFHYLIFFLKAPRPVFLRLTCYLVFFRQYILSAAIIDLRENVIALVMHKLGFFSCFDMVYIQFRHNSIQFSTFLDLFKSQFDLHLVLVVLGRSNI